MTITFVQGSETQNTGGGNQTNVAFSTQPTVGNLCVVGSCWPGGGSDPSAPSGWTQVGSTIYPYEGNKDSLILWAKILVSGDIQSGGALGWQVPVTPFTSPLVIGAEFSGVSSATASATGSVSPTVPGASPTDLAISLTSSGDALEVMLTRLHAFTGSASLSAGTSTTMAANRTGLEVTGLAYRIITGAGTNSITTRATWTNALWAGAVGGLFDAAGGIPPRAFGYVIT